MVGRGVHQQHAKKHNVSRDTTSLCVVNLKSDLGSHLHTLDVEETTLVSLDVWITAGRYSLDIMRYHVEDGEEQHSIGDLSVEPHGFIQRHKARLGSQPSEDVSAHGHNDNHGVN